MRIDERVYLLVDELDASVYEYLLGEILYVLEHDSSGRFIFTSHNLRALETLSKDAIAFTTINPQNRYYRFNNVKPRLVLAWAELHQDELLANWKIVI